MKNPADNAAPSAGTGLFTPEQLQRGIDWRIHVFGRTRSGGQVEVVQFRTRGTREHWQTYAETRSRKTSRAKRDALLKCFDAEQPS